MPFNFLKSILIILSIFFGTSSIAQKMNFEDFHVVLHEKKLKDHVSIPFKTLRIIDNRFDTTKIGYADFGSRYKNIVFKNGTSNSLGSYLNTMFSQPLNTNDRSLVIVLKNLWLNEIKAGEKRKQTLENEKKNISQCMIKADVYVFSNNGYQSLIRVDTVFEDFHPLKNISEGLLFRTFEFLVTKISDINIEQAMLKKTRISEIEVNRYYEQRFNKPRLIQDGMQRGIYLSFNDFVSNNPTFFNFSLEQDEEADYLYIEEKGEQKLFTDFWGFSDGQSHYIRIGYNFF